MKLSRSKVKGIIEAQKKNPNINRAKLKIIDNVKITDSPTSNNDAKQGVIGLKELGLTLKDVRNQTPVFVPTKHEVQLIGFAKSPSDSVKVLKKFENQMYENPQMTFKQYRITQRKQR